jgi:hypothetical protein|tara:strand:- start:491 stop:766 length:276 start_codon:yes stop_codon:yes gene_type:complete
MMLAWKQAVGKRSESMNTHRFIEQVSRVNTTLGSIASALEDIRDAEAMGEVVVEECQKDVGVDRIVLRVSVLRSERDKVVVKSLNRRERWN